MLSECKDLDAYFQRYGELLGARATKALDPLHVPGRDPEVDGIEIINQHVIKTRQSVLFGAQRDTLSGLVKALNRQKAVWLAAEMGTGKSLMGGAAAHIHAKGKPYRGLVMCPDHLIKKWKREIERTCPSASVRTFDDWREVLTLVQRHDKPTAPEWWVIGRDQSKGDPAWEPRVVKSRVLIAPVVDIRALKQKGAPMEDLIREVAACPKCGTKVTDKDGNPKGYREILKSKKKLTCNGSIVRYVMEGDDCKEHIQECNEPLWTFVAARNKAERDTRRALREGLGLEVGTAPYRWPAYRSVKGQMRRPFDYLILDEVHELKGGDEVGQANAAGAFIACSKKVIALTGTLIGGFADHLFPMLLRMAPQSLRAGGYEWNEFAKFNARYGRIETVYHTKGGSRRDDDDDSGSSNSHTKGSSTKITRIRRPGIMPQLYGDHLIDKAAFLALDQVADGLPPLSETIIPVPMDAEQTLHYEELEGWLRSTVKQMMAMGNKRLLGAMLENLLYWPDHPYGWPLIDAGKEGSFLPASLDVETIRPKEEALVDLCKSEMAAGRQVWVYVQRTVTRDVGARLVRLLRDAGMRADQLRSSTSPREREEWIYRKGRDLDVCVSHPDLVKTGLDLFAPDGNHNFPTLVFYQTGYNTFTLRQASRRSWRIGQKLPCKTVFLYYTGSFQESCMAHMGKKMSACEAIDGKFSAEGLAAMAGEDDATMALAKSLVEKVVIPASAWTKTMGFAPTNGHAPQLTGATGGLPTSVRRPSPPVVTPAQSSAPLSFTPDELETLRRVHAMLCGA